MVLRSFADAHRAAAPRARKSAMRPDKPTNPAQRDPRNRELAAIHIGKKRLGLDDATYRDMLWTVARVRSAAELDAHGRRAVLEHMRARGYHATTRPKVRVAESRERMVAKVRAMLAEAHRPDSYADSMAKRMFSVEQFIWLKDGELHKLVAALVYDQKRRQTRESQ